MSFVQPSDVRAASVDIGTYADRIGQAEMFVADHRSTELLPPSTDHEDLLQLNREADRQYAQATEAWAVNLRIIGHAVRGLAERAERAAAEYQGADRRVADSWLDQVEGG